MAVPPAAVLFVRGFDSGWLGMPPPNLARHREAIVLVTHRDPYGVDWGEQMPRLVPLPAVAALVLSRNGQPAGRSIFAISRPIGKHPTLLFFPVRETKVTCQKTLLIHPAWSLGANASPPPGLFIFLS